MPTDGFWVTIIGFADEPQSIRGQQPTVASVTAELFVIGNLLLGECLFHNRPPYKNNRAVPAFRLHRKSSFYTAKAHFLIIPARCIKYAKIISKYFDTLNHEILINLLRKNVKDERVVQLIKRYLKSGVMENGVVIDTEEGSPQGGNLSPLLANVYLNEFDQEFLKRGVPCIRYADDIVLLAKSKRASERLLESSTKYLEKRLKLTVNREKSRTVSVFAIRNFKFLGFALGRNGKGTYVRVHSKSWKKFKSRLKELSSRKRCQSIKPSLEKIKVYARGWLNYYGIASMKSNIDDINGWLYHRIRMCIWKQWKKPRTKYKNLVKLGIPEHYASTIANSRRKYWYISNNKAVIWALNKERLINSGFYDLATAYQSVHVNY